MDKHAVAYAEHRRQVRAAKAAAPKVEAAPAVVEEVEDVEPDEIKED